MAPAPAADWLALAHKVEGRSRASSRWPAARALQQDYMLFALYISVTDADNQTPKYLVQTRDLAFSDGLAS